MESELVLLSLALVAGVLVGFVLKGEKEEEEHVWAVTNDCGLVVRVDDQVIDGSIARILPDRRA